MKVIIVHGFCGHPQENWFQYIKKNLDIETIIPQFPNADNPKLEEWMKTIEKYEIDQDTILVGHSLGVPFILNVLEKYQCKAAFLVAGFVAKINHDFDEKLKDIAQKDFDWEKIKQNCPHFYLFNSDNDKYVALEKAYELKNFLNAELTIINNGGHINKSAGYTEFPQLLNEIKKIK